MQLDARVAQPLAEIGNGSWIVVVEMRSGGEELQQLEVVGRHIDDVVAGEAPVVEEMSRDTESAVRHVTILTIDAVGAGRVRPPDVQRTSSRCVASNSLSRPSRG